MQNILVIVTLLFLLPSSALAQSAPGFKHPASGLTCEWQTSFGPTEIKCNYYDIGIRMKPKQGQLIRYMELFIDYKSMGKDTQWPFSFVNKRQSVYLRPGIHKVKVKIVDRCRKISWMYKTVYLKKCPT